MIVELSLFLSFLLNREKKEDDLFLDASLASLAWVAGPLDS